MKIQDRLTPYPACDAIDLDAEEKEIYRGCGWNIAGFRDGKLARLHELDAEILDTLDNSVTEAVRVQLAALTEMERDGLECWLVMCSCTQLCEPTPVATTPDDELVLTAAKFARRIGEELHRCAEECGGWDDLI